MNDRISESILVPYDVKCKRCPCRKEGVHGSIGKSGEPMLKNEDCSCGHSLLEDHEIVRETPSDYEKKMSGEI